jgi:hypothetical protein
VNVAALGQPGMTVKARLDERQERLAPDLEIVVEGATTAR